MKTTSAEATDDFESETQTEGGPAPHLQPQAQPGQARITPLQDMGAHVKAFDPVGMKQAGKATNNHGSEIIFSKDRLAHYPYISATVYIDADAARRRSPLADSTRCSRELCRRRKTSLRTRVSLIRGETIAGPIPRLTRYGLEPLGDH
jgi:hypothetical protein